jgi:succinoglycan biosynthesis transport protein ExoP
MTAPTPADTSEPQGPTPARDLPVPAMIQGGRAQPSDDTSVHLLSSLRVLHKRRWTALAAFAVVLLTGTVSTLTTIPTYEASVQILIEKENDNVVTFKQPFEQNQIADDYYQTQYKILQSRALVRRTLDKGGLWDSEELQPTNPGANTETSLSMLLKPLSAWLTIPHPEPSEPPQDETASQSRKIDAVLSHLTVVPVRNTRLVELKYRSHNPAAASQFANALASSYIDQSLEYKLSASKEASDWLGQQLVEQRKKVEESEQALQQYRERTDSVSLEDRQNIVVQKLTDLNAAVTRAKTDRIQKETSYNQIRNVQADRAALDSIPAILSNAFIQQQKAQVAELQRQQTQLSENFGPNHPEMRKAATAIRQAEDKLQAEIDRTISSMRNDYLSSLAQERSLTEALERQKEEAQSLSRKGIDYGALQRDAAMNRQIFESLLQRTKETGIAGEMKTSHIRILDTAEVPRQSISPNVNRDVWTRAWQGMFFALVLVFAFEYFDSRISRPDEISSYLSIPFLGMVPALSKTVKHPRICDTLPATFAESFRCLRSNILFSTVSDGGRAIVVTSTGPGEGKSVVASNVAIALAQSGQRVLIVDGDMRRPTLHQMFSIPQSPGLSNIIVGDAKASDGVQATAVSGLWMLPAGVSPPNPAELLGSRRFTELLQAVKGHFDWVIIDSPPVMPVTDAAIIAHQTTGVLFVVGADMTTRQTAKRAVAQLTHARGRILGATLNRVDLKNHSFYYADYYRREYGEYYGHVSSGA